MKSASAIAIHQCVVEATLFEETPMTATDSHFAPMAPGAQPPAAAGFATGAVRATLRLEGAMAFACALALYARAGLSWPVFALAFLSPDLAMLAYLAGPRKGAVAYNLAHTYALALALALTGLFLGAAPAAAAGLIWIAHIGLDRALGYGLKYASGFGDSHLGRIGRA
jgi:Domain of unknown function (DUF4260)